MLIAAILNPQKTTRTGLFPARWSDRPLHYTKRSGNQIEISSRQRVRDRWKSAKRSGALITNGKTRCTAYYNRAKSRILACGTAYVFSKLSFGGRGYRAAVIDRDLGVFSRFDLDGATLEQHRPGGLAIVLIRAAAVRPNEKSHSVVVAGAASCRRSGS